MGVAGCCGARVWHKQFNCDKAIDGIFFPAAKECDAQFIARRAYSIRIHYLFIWCDVSVTAASEENSKPITEITM